MQFLYTGDSPTQTGVAFGTIDGARAGVIRGRVLSADGTTPAVGIAVAVVGHPELGQTLTRTGGWYDLAVNGGDIYNVDVNQTGYLRVQRQVRTKPLGYSLVEDIVLTAPVAGDVPFLPGAATGRVVHGAITPAGTDSDASRSARVYFPPGTRTTNYAVADGTALPLQITEYTVAQGPQRMPGTLPPTSGYTYALEVGIPDAAAAGVADLHFDKDVVIYISNFTGYPVGQTVPLGYYDRTKAAWLTEKSGRIIKVLSVSGGVAQIDVDNDNVADNGSPTKLAALGLTDPALITAELSMLGQESPSLVGQSLWRCPVPHFSPWDANWGYGPPPSAPAPPPPDPDDDDPDDPCDRSGSIIGCESRTLGEVLPVFGTPYSLHYQSERAAGFRSRLKIRITDGTALPATLKRAHVEIEAAGRLYHYTREAPVALNDSLIWTWDGTDAYGRTIDQGVVDARIRVGFEYGGSPTFSTSAFGEASANGATLTGDRTARTVTLWKEAHQKLRRSNAKALGFGGWTLDVNHLLANEDTIYFGNGRRRTVSTGSALAMNYIVDTFAGGGAYPNYGDDGPAAQAYIGPNINDIAAGPDGSLYIAHDGNFTNGRIRRVGADGIITSVAGATPAVARSASSNGSPALNAQVFPTSIAMLPDGSIAFTEPNNNQVWKIQAGPTPTLRLVAGSGGPHSPGDCTAPPPACGDGGPATAALLFTPTAVVAAADGTLFVADRGHGRVRRIGPEGTITTYFTNANWPEQLSLRADGTLFARLQGDPLARIEPSGAFSGLVKEPGGATSLLNTNWCGQASAFFGAVAPLADESMLVTCYSQVMYRSPLGILLRVGGPASNAVSGYAGDGGPAARALFGQMKPIAIGAKDDIFVGDAASGRIRRLRPPAPARTGETYSVPAEDGSEVYEFSLSGRHLSTLTSLRGAPRLSFGYDPSTSQLTSITDEGGNVTQISRGAGAVTITAPHGQVTTLNLDANGYVSTVTNPVNAEITQLAYSSEGLLSDLVDPRAHAHHFEYGTDGRLTRDVDATPGSLGTRLVTTSTSSSYTVEITSPEGRVTRHEVNRNQSFGDTAVIERRRITNGAGLTTEGDKSVDRAMKVTRPDGSTSTVQETAADPRWGGLASYAKKLMTQVGSHTTTRDESRSVTLGAAGDPFSVTAQTIATTLSGAGVPTAVTTRTFAGGSPATWTTLSPAGRQTRETLDSLDRVVKTELLGSTPILLNPVEYHYDALGRVDQVTWGSRVYGTSFNATTGWVDSTTAPAALGVAFGARDDNGRPTLMTLPGSRSLAMSYDLAGNVTSVTPPNQPAHLFTFDPNDRLASYAPPDLVPVLAPKDTLYAWDRDGLAVLASHPGKPVSYAYDSLGRVTSRVDAVTTTQAYDAQGRLATIATSDGVTLTNTYDGTLLVTQTLSVAGLPTHTVNKTFDNFLRASSWNVDGASPVAVAYDGDSLVTAAGTMTVNSGTNGLLTSTTIGSVSDTFAYNAYGEVTTHGVSGLTGAITTFNVTTTRDAAGRIDVRTETIGTATTSYRYEYDAAGRLAAVYENGSMVAARSWTYDGNGNRDGGTYDGQDRLLTMAGATYSYGNNGELTKKNDGVADTLYDYDAHGNLRGVTRPAPQAAIAYVIDGLNRRVGKKVNGSLVQGFVYDGSRVVAELDGAGAVVARFVYATGGHSPDFVIKSAATYRLVKDHLGSPRLVVNVATGAVAQRLDYDEWGVVTLDSSPGFQPFGFAGGILDRDSGFVRFGSRDYEPGVGRWTTKDRSRFRGWLNLYGYANDDPINYVDISGHYAWTVGGAVAVAIASGVAGPLSVGLAAGAVGLLSAAFPGGPPGPTDGTVAPGSGGGLSQSPAPGTGPAPGDSGGGLPAPPGNGGDDEEDDCKQRASKWELKDACIDPHDVKPKPWSRFEICKCKSGGFAIKRWGCTGPILDRL